MNCKKCGEEIDKDDKFCTTCGTLIEEENNNAQKVVEKK